MKKYFKLNPFCHLVDGFNGGCVYNLSTGDIIFFEEEKYNILKQCEKNIQLSNISNCNASFIEKLYNLNIGMYFDVPVYVEKLSIGMPKALTYSENKNYNINAFYIELTNECNFNCVFCPENSNVLYRRTGCKRWKIGNKIEDLSVWKKIIYQISKLHCQQLVFIGGEPFLKIKLLREIVTFASSCNINNFLIFTNGTLVDAKIIDFIKKYNVKLRIQILASTDAVYEKITNYSKAQTIISNNLRMLQSNHIDFDLVLFVTSLNENEVEIIVKYYNQFITKDKKIKLDTIYPNSQNDFCPKSRIESLFNKKKFLREMHIEDFCYANKFHNCYGHNLAISADGNIFPCIMSRNLLLGNISENTIADILRNSKYDHYRRLTKDKIDGCKQCAFKYGCFDCRAIEMYSTGKINGMQYCNLKPVIKHNETT